MQVLTQKRHPQLATIIPSIGEILLFWGFLLWLQAAPATLGLLGSTVSWQRTMQRQLGWPELCGACHYLLQSQTCMLRCTWPLSI